MTVLYYYTVKKEKKVKINMINSYLGIHFRTFYWEIFWNTSYLLCSSVYIYIYIHIYIHNGILLNHKKEWNNAIWSNMNGSRDCHTEWSKSDGERQILYVIIYMCARACKVASVMSVCDPMHHGFPGSSDREILQGRILEWVTTFSSRRSSWPRDQTRVSYISWIGKQILYH